MREKPKLQVPNRFKSNIRKIRSSARWQKVSAKAKALFPICLDPYNHHSEDGRIAKSEETHHIVPLAQAPEKAFDMDNLACLCITCHKRIEKEPIARAMALLATAKLDYLKDNF